MDKKENENKLNENELNENELDMVTGGNLYVNSCIGCGTLVISNNNASYCEACYKKLNNNN